MADKTKTIDVEMLPGAPAAIGLGCLCDPKENRNGRGAMSGHYGTGFAVNDACPMHKNMPELGE